MPRHPDTQPTFTSPAFSWHLDGEHPVGDARFDRVSSLVFRLLHAPFVLLALFEGEELVLQNTAGTLEPDISICVAQLAYEASYRVARSGAALAISARPVFTCQVYDPPIATRSMAYLGVPMLTSGTQVVGVMSVVAPGPRQWSDNDITALQDLATIVVPAVTASQPHPLAGQPHTRASAYLPAARDTHQKTPPTPPQSETYFRTLIENAPDVIVMVALDGTLQYGSPSIEHILGYRVENLLGTNAFTLIQAKDRIRVRKQFVRALKHAGVVTALEVRVKHKDSSWRMLEVLGKGNSDANGTRSITLHARDVTDRMEVQEVQQRERSRLARRIAERTMELSAANIELARSARLKDEFLASISHELRTPLSVILGLAEALQEQVYGAVLPRQLQALRDIEDSGQHLLVLINDLLDLSKLEAGTLEVQCAPVMIAEVCQSSLQMIMQEAEHKHIEVALNLDAAVTNMLADQVRLKQLLFHLLSNAVKFTPACGTIGLDVTIDTEHDLVRFSVWDSGIGIAHDHLQRLFRPFVQLDSRLARQYAGTGLGLVIVSRLVELHGGGITVESEIGHGSRFNVWLPWRKHELQAARADLV